MLGQPRHQALVGTQFFLQSRQRLLTRLQLNQFCRLLVAVVLSGFALLFQARGLCFQILQVLRQLLGCRLCLKQLCL